MKIFGYFRDRDLTIRELKKRFVYKIGDLGYLQAECFEYLTMQWSESCYCLVSTGYKVWNISNHLSCSVESRG